MGQLSPDPKCKPPKPEFIKLYNYLCMSYLAYFISCWGRRGGGGGGVSVAIISKKFSIEMRCVRLLFCKEPSYYDIIEYYLTCARVRTYMSIRNPNVRP